MSTDACTSDLVTCARSYLGVRFRHQGRSSEGLDCAGLVVRVFAERRASRFDFAHYERQASDETMLRLCAQEIGPMVTDLSPGDVVVMRFDNQRHIGLLGDYPGGLLSLIHAHILARQVVEHRLDDAWRARILAVFRWANDWPSRGLPCN